MEFKLQFLNARPIQRRSHAVAGYLATKTLRRVLEGLYLLFGLILLEFDKNRYFLLCLVISLS